MCFEYRVYLCSETVRTFLPPLKFIGETRKYEQSIYAMIKSGTTRYRCHGIAINEKKHGTGAPCIRGSLQLGKPEFLCVRVHVQKPRPTLAKEAIDEDLGIMCTHVFVRVQKAIRLLTKRTEWASTKQRTKPAGALSF